MWHMGEHSSLAVFQVIETFDPKKTTVDAYMEDIRANVVAHVSRDTFPPGRSHSATHSARTRRASKIKSWATPS